MRTHPLIWTLGADATRMHQIALFDAGESVLAEDERGRIEYVPRFLPPPLAQAWFAELRGNVSWEAGRRWMYDRQVDVPRLTAHFDLGQASTRDAPLPAAIPEAATRVTTRTGVTFNSVGLNLYRDGRDSVAAHNDHLNELVPGFPIALVSLGATRRMTIRAKEQPRRVLHVDLEGGSLLIMSYETQLHYTHGVTKTPGRVGERISLAFRVRPASDASAGRAGKGYYRSAREEGTSS
jgi:alkylated DNA repair dioxygenase AlkB